MGKYKTLNSNDFKNGRTKELQVLHELSNGWMDESMDEFMSYRRYSSTNQGKRCLVQTWRGRIWQSAKENQENEPNKTNDSTNKQNKQ